MKLKEKQDNQTKDTCNYSTQNNCHTIIAQTSSIDIQSHASYDSLDDTDQHNHHTIINTPTFITQYIVYFQQHNDPFTLRPGSVYPLHPGLSTVQTRV